MRIFCGTFGLPVRLAMTKNGPNLASRFGTRTSFRQLRMNTEREGSKPEGGPMTRKQLQKYRDVLLRLVRRVEDDASTVREQARDASGGQAFGGLSNAPMHMGDLGSEEYLQELNATLLENEEHLSEEVWAALGRIKDGTFGRCESCGGTIRSVRLNAIPYARFCVGCAQVQELQSRVNLNTGRPGARTAIETGSEGRDSRPRQRSRDQSSAGLEDASGHAAGTAGGGAAHGGLSGSNFGHGDPDVNDLDLAMGNGDYDSHEAGDEESHGPRTDREGGNVEGTPVERRNP
jgi:RNA polymerase-binding transcription factor DksA